MPSIAFFTAHRRFPWSRQLEPERPAASGWRITLDREEDDCRLVVVYDEPPAGLVTRLPRARRLVILSEPPGIKTYRAGYLEQFGLAMGPIAPDGAAGTTWLEGQPALPWFYGIGFEPGGLVANLSTEAIAAMPAPAKLAALSVVLSRKSQLPKHRARLGFVEALQKRLGKRLSVFGRGFTEISDKAEAIDPFAYHLALENNDIPHFFTEKTADALLGWALPLFSGCANIGAYLPDKAYVPLDIGQRAAALDQVERLLDEHPYHRHLPAIAEARMRLIGPLNLRNRLIEIADQATAPVEPGESISLRPTSDFDLVRRVRKAWTSLRK